MKKHHIETAKEMALNNGAHGFHLAALLYRRGKLITIGVNSETCRPQHVRHYSNGVAYTAHAEMEALRYAKPGDKLYVLRWRKGDKHLAMAKPCPYCMVRIKRRKVTVYYSDQDGDIVKLC